MIDRYAIKMAPAMSHPEIMKQFAAGAAGTPQMNGQMVALTANFQGAAASRLGSSREWYAPSSGLFRVERSWQGHGGTDSPPRRRLRCPSVAGRPCPPSVADGAGCVRDQTGYRVLLSA